jgi:phosphatidate cytidylyltransferase
MGEEFAERLHRSSLWPRVLTAVAGIPLVMLSLWAGEVWWAVLTAAVAALGWAEFVRLHALGRLSRSIVAVQLAGLFAVLYWGDEVLLPILLTFWALAIVFAGAGFFLRSEDPGRGYRTAAALALGAFYLGVPTSILARWRMEYAAWSILAFLLVIWANDTAAYFVGLAAGRHKLAPRISPGKSWEGAAAGLVAGAIVGGAAADLLQMQPVWGLLFGALTTIASQFGDLFESAMKRKAGMKDSGTLLPGHGGILDRFDGILVAAPIAYMLIRAWAGNG